METNNQLYEGIYYAIINVTDPGPKPWSISQFRRKCQVVPTNYEGAFTSSDPLLDRIWWTGAYTVKVTEVGNGLNSKGGFLGSELKDRGDRIAFLGDAHVAQATALYAFGNYRMLNNSNYYTAKIGNGTKPCLFPGDLECVKNPCWFLFYFIFLRGVLELLLIANRLQS